MVLIINTEKQQLTLFPESTLPVIPPRETPDDVQKGEVAENIAMLAIKGSKGGYHAL